MPRRLAQIDRRLRAHVLFLLDSREREEIVDQAGHPASLFAHDGEEFVARLRIGVRGALQGFDEAQQRGQRRAQFVARVGDEVGAHPLHPPRFRQIAQGQQRSDDRACVGGERRDADLEQAAALAIAGGTRNSGQRCTAVKRIVVDDTVADELATLITKGAAALNIGDPFDPLTDVGTLIDEQAARRVESWIDEAAFGGARVVTGGKRHGAQLQPTVIAEATKDMRIFREETFGPVAPVFRFKTDREAIELANATEFGLAAYFYGRDIARVWRVAETLEYGIVGINTGIISTEVAPFGGVKESGLGREGSKYGMDEYVEIKYLCFGGITP